MRVALLGAVGWVLVGCVGHDVSRSLEVKAMQAAVQTQLAEPTVVLPQPADPVEPAELSAVAVPLEGPPPVVLAEPSPPAVVVAEDPALAEPERTPPGVSEAVALVAPSAAAADVTALLVLDRLTRELQELRWSGLLDARLGDRGVAPGAPPAAAGAPPAFESVLAELAEAQARTREIQERMLARLEDLDARQVAADGQLGELVEGMSQLLAQQTATADRLQRLEERLTAFEQRPEPPTEADGPDAATVAADLDAARARFEEAEKRLDALVSEGYRDLDRRLQALEAPEPASRRRRAKKERSPEAVPAEEDVPAAP